MRERRELAEAATKGDFEQVTKLVEADPSLATAQDVEDGATALHIAVWNGHVKIVQWLLDRGADLSVRDGRHHGTPLNWAIFSGRNQIAQMLIARGAKPAPQMLDMAILGSKGQFAGFSPTKDKNEYVKLVELLKRQGLKEPAAGHESPEEDATLFAEALHDPSKWDEAVKAEQVKIEGAWSPAAKQKFDASGEQNVLFKMVPLGGSVGRHEEGLSVGDAQDQHGLITPEVYAVPLRIEVQARVENKNLRLYYARASMIFDWEAAPEQLRVSEPGTGEQWGVKGKGFLGKGQWNTIVWEIHNDGMRVLVNGVERMSASGNYAGVKGRVGVGSAWGNAVVIRRVEVRGI
jgi:hypothetical protein